LTQSRQLAAIMFTDIVGYTALMGKDEQKAFELLKKIELYNDQLLSNTTAGGSKRSVMES
jgi:hypothetical protein